MKAKSIDRAIANAAAYSGPENPFPEGSRLWRYFRSARQHYEDIEARFRDLESVYGPAGTNSH